MIISNETLLFVNGVGVVNQWWVQSFRGRHPQRRDLQRLHILVR